MTDSTRVKRKLVAGLDEGRAAARAFVSRLPPDLPVHEDSDWTARDLVIHLTALESDMVRAAHCAMAGEAFAVELRGQADAPALYELRRRDMADRRWHDLLRAWERAREQLRGVVLAFPGEKMQTRFPTPFFEDCDLIAAVRACEAHERLHLAEMRAALARHGTTEDSDDIAGGE